MTHLVKFNTKILVSQMSTSELLSNKVFGINGVLSKQAWVADSCVLWLSRDYYRKYIDATVCIYV